MNTDGNASQRHFIESNISWPDKFSDELVDALLSIAKVIELSKKNQLHDIMHKGMFYVVQGSLTPCLMTQSVRTVTGIVLGKGAWFGNSNLNKVPTPNMQIELIEPTQLIFFPVKICAAIAEKNVEMYKWLWTVNIDISSRWLQAQVMAGEDIVSRVAYVLLEMASQKAVEQSALPMIKASQFQLSTITGISRPRLNETLKKFEQEGEIEIARSCIAILDLNKLGSRLDTIDLSYRDPRLNLKWS